MSEPELARLFLSDCRSRRQPPFQNETGGSGCNAVTCGLHRRLEILRNTVNRSIWMPARGCCLGTAVVSHLDDDSTNDVLAMTVRRQSDRRPLHDLSETFQRRKDPVLGVCARLVAVRRIDLDSHRKLSPTSPRRP